MSKEREMIEKLCSFQMTYSDWLLLIADAEELLAQPEQAVAECTNSDTWNCKYCNKTESCGALKDSRNFAPPKRKPLSTKQAEDLWETTFKSAVPYYIFDEICVAIEQYYGIGEKNDS